MNIIVTILFLQPLVLVTLYLYVSGAFTNRRVFQATFYILLALFALTIGIGGTQLSYQGYDLLATTPVSTELGEGGTLISTGDAFGLNVPSHSMERLRIQRQGDAVG